MDFVIKIAAEANSITAFPQLRTLFSHNRIKSIIELSKPQLRSDHILFDDNPWIAGCQGGILDLRTGQLVKPPDIVTKRLGTSVDPDARCPVFESFLYKIFAGDGDKIAFLQRAVGYTLTGLTIEQGLFVLIGMGANGKSTLLRIVGKLMGDYAGSIPMHTLMVSRYGSEKTDDLASLKGLRFVSAQEGEAGERLAEAKIKLMTGGDPISARRLYGNYEIFQPQFKLWLATNDLPKIGGTGDAIWRRIHVIEFPVSIPAAERDPKLDWCIPGRI